MIRRLPLVAEASISAGVDTFHSRDILLKANALMLLDDLQAAIETYNDAERSGLHSFDLYVNRGFAFAEIEQFENALSDYQTALSLDSNNTLALINYA